MSKSRITWTDEVWNPVTGCTKVSQGCKNCYAEREWPRMTRLVPAYAGRAFSDVRTHPDRLDKPLHWKRPRRIFVNSMSDLFHESVPDEFIDQVFAVMALAPQHTFQILTKRAGRMREYLSHPSARVRIGLAAMAMCLDAAVETNGRSDLGTGVALKATDINPGGLNVWPLLNVWLGVSAENQPEFDARVVELLKTPAAVHWVSIEPLLGPINSRRIQHPNYSISVDALGGIDPRPSVDAATLNWVVVGGESGPNARPMHPQWARDLRDQCAAAGVPFLFKQWGEFLPAGQVDNNGDEWTPAGTRQTKVVDDGFRPIGKKRAGRLLDGVLHDAYPEVK
jgi:protein gp37